MNQYCDLAGMRRKSSQSGTAGLMFMTLRYRSSVVARGERSDGLEIVFCATITRSHFDACGGT